MSRSRLAFRRVNKGGIVKYKMRRYASPQLYQVVGLNLRICGKTIHGQTEVFALDGDRIIPLYLVDKPKRRKPGAAKLPPF